MIIYKIVMITRVIKQLQFVLHKPNVFYLSSSDKFKNKGKSEKGAFFGRNKNKEENKQIPQSHKTQKHQNKSFKSPQFQNKKQKKGAGSHPQKIHQNEKQVQTKKIEQPQRVEEITLKLRKTQAEKPNTQPQVHSQQIGQTISQLLNKVNKAREQGEQFQHLDIENENENECIKKILYSPLAYKKMTDSKELLNLFDTKQWQDLQNKLVLLKSEDMPVEKIINITHNLFIKRQTVKYAQWISQKSQFFAHLSHKVLIIVFYNLLNNNQLEMAKKWISILQKRGVDLGYEFMDSIFSTIDKNASLSILRATIPCKIQFALYILNSISNIAPNQPKCQEGSQKASKCYMLGTWFANLWFIAKERYLFMPQFIQLFEQLTIKHKKRMNLSQIHANGLFLDVIENYYFGSHIDSIKLNALFSHVFNQHDFHDLMISFRNILMQYKVKTGKAPFPIIENFYEQLKQSLLLSQYNRALFYFQLCSVQGQEEPFQVFEDNPQLIKAISFQTNIDILKDGLLCANKKNLESQTKKTRGEKKSHHKQKIITNYKAASIQQFLSRNDKSQTIPYTVGAIGLNKEFIDILANRDQTEVNPRSINKEKLRAGNQQLFQNQDEEYYLSQNENENDQYGQIIDANEQISKKMKEINQIVASEQIDQQNQVQNENKSSEIENQQNREQLSEESEDQQQLQLKQSYAKDGEPYVLGYEQDSDFSYDQHPYVRNMNQLYNNQLKNQCHTQKNFLRKELLKVMRLSSNPLHTVKAAIKLGKPQYAWTIFKQKIMKHHIQERMLKNIDYVIRAFVLEHSQNNHQYDIHQIMDSLHRFKYEFLDNFDRDGAQNLKEDYILKNTSFSQSIYERLENFDQLVWQHLPQGKLKHQFWQSTLVLQRAQELLKLQAQGKLQNFQYEREHYEIQTNKLTQIFPKQLSWRDQLIYGLGIAAPEQVPIKSVESNPSIYLKFEDQSEFKEYILNPLTQKYSPPVKLRTAQQHTQIKGQIAEGEEAVAEGEEVQAAEGEEVQVEEGGQGEVVQGEIAQAAQGQQQTAAQTQEEAQAQQQTAASVQQLEAQQEVEQTQVIPDQQTADASDTHQGQDLIVKNKNIFQYSQENKIKGYDFQAFMQINKLKLKPFFQQQYQQNEKQFKKYFLALEALVQEAYLYDNHSLQKKLVDVQSYIKDSFTIAKMTSFGLWNFDFVTVQQPFQYLQRSHEFIQKFFTFKKYMGDKLPQDIPNLKKQRIQNFNQIVHNRRVTHQLVEQLLIKRHHLFKEAEAIVRLDAHQAVDDIILWGLYNDQPLAVYMGQKLAMLTNQKIPHKLSLLVARYLSHRREVPQTRVERCKQALKIVGRINREHIYELSKDYQHITVRKHLRSYIQKRQEELDSSALQHLSRLEPTYATQDTTFNLKNKISRGNLTV